MKLRMVRKMMTVLILLTLPLISHAASYHISWKGANNYHMTGMFSYSDSLINTGLINASHLDSFTIEGFWDKAPLGSFQLDQTPINFNFDTSTQMLVTGGESGTTGGQQWNAPNTNGGFGFFSGNSTQGLYDKGARINDSEILIGSKCDSCNVDSTLAATPIHTTEMPEPSTWVLLVTGLIGFLAFTWCRDSNGGKGNFQNKAG
jgi:hypothetical protein